MRGATLERDTVVTIVLFLVLLAIIIMIIYVYIYGYHLPAASAEAYLDQKCFDWVREGCTRDSALSIKIMVDDNEKTLDALCEEYFNAEGTFWDTSSDTYEKCKKHCMYCPA